MEITDRISVHWLAGSFEQEFEEIADLVHSLTGGADFFPLPHSKFGFKSAYLSIGGLLVLAEPGSVNVGSELDESVGLELYVFVGFGLGHRVLLEAA